MGCTVSAWGSQPQNASFLHALTLMNKCASVFLLLHPHPPHGKYQISYPLLSYPFPLLELLKEVDSQSMVLNGLVADIVSLNTKTNTYKEVLGQQNCEIQTRQCVANWHMHMPGFQSLS